MELSGSGAYCMHIHTLTTHNAQVMITSGLGMNALLKNVLSSNYSGPRW